jgi:hypothetical protein
VQGLGEYLPEGALDYAATSLVATIALDLHPGDANLDTKTNVLDFNVWNENKFASATEPGRLVRGQEPEPGTLILLLAALTFAAVYYRRRAA